MGQLTKRYVTHVLEKLRARDGVTLRRLQAAAQGVAAPLLSLHAVQRYASLHQVDATKAALAVVAECVRDALTGTERIVADAALALGVLAETHYRDSIEPRVVELVLPSAESAPESPACELAPPACSRRRRAYGCAKGFGRFAEP